jgi:phage shock protein B
MEDVLVPIMVVGMLFIGLPWLVMHYVTRWKTAATLTNDDERMLGDMHELARRLEDRLDTVERLVAQDNPDWHPRRLDHETEAYLSESNIRKLERNR